MKNKPKKEVTQNTESSTPIKLEDNDYKHKLEALLFSAGKRLEVDFLASIIGATDKGLIKKSLNELKKEYDERNSPLMIVEEANSWKITVREKYLPIVRKIVADTELSKTVMETLAVIAWKSPALQSDIIKIRTNKAYDHIDELLDTGFVTKEKKGRSFILKVTSKFYEYFDIEGKEGIKDVFSKIQEKPIQRKVDEFKTESVGKLKVVDTVKNNSVKNAEDAMDKQRIGALEVYDEEEKANEESDIENNSYETKNKSVISEANKEEKVMLETQKNEEDLKKKTRKIVEDLLKDDKREKK